VVTAEVPWVDSLLAEDELVDVSEVVVGVLELVEDSVPLAVPDDPLVDDSPRELPLVAAWFALLAFFVAAALAAARFADALFSAALLLPVLPATVGVLAAAVPVFVDRAGSCPEASCT
jgi:uncharacterized membrane protein YhaH (DUF805 family)